MTDVEDALRTLLEERAEDVEWNPALVTRAVAAGTAARAVPAGSVWLAAAAAAVLVVGAVSMAVGSRGSGDPATRVSTPAGSSTVVGAGGRWRSCAEAFGVGALQFTAAGDGGLVSSMPPPPATSYVPPPDTSVPALPSFGTGTVPVQSAPTAPDSPPPTDVVDPLPDSPQGAAENEAWGQLDQVLDGQRFAGWSRGPGAGVLTIHVVRGVDEAGARALVGSCAHRGLTYRTDLVQFSGAELRAVSQAAIEALGAGGATYDTAGVDYRANRALLVVSGELSDAQKATLTSRFGGRLLVWLRDSRTYWRA